VSPQEPVTAYVVADVEWHDEVQHAIESKDFLQILERFGGRFLVSSKNSETVEGRMKFRTLVILEFPSKHAFRLWYDSREYAPIKAIRLNFADTNAVVADTEG
jgi:uncharacterized protein (DUF1330 family)